MTATNEATMELERLRAALREVLGWFVPSGDDHMFAMRPARDYAAVADVLPERHAGCEHNARIVYPGSAVDVGGYWCDKCGERREGGRMVHEADGLWWESLDWDGSVIARYRRGGPAKSARVLGSEGIQEP